MSGLLNPTTLLAIVKLDLVRPLIILERNWSGLVTITNIIIQRERDKPTTKMSIPVDIEQVMDNLKKIPMSQERFDGLKAKILQSRALNGPDESVRDLQNMTMKCVQDIKERLALITERRKQRNMEDKQRNSEFAAALAERNEVKESENTTKRGQKIHRTRIELWRDEVKQHSLAEKKTTSCGMPQQQSTRQFVAKRPHDVESSSLEQPATATPANKRIKTVTRNDSSSAVAPPTSSKKSIPWLSTRASMADEDVFADDDRPVSNQELRFDNKKNANDDHDEHDEYDDADEDFDEDDDADSEGSYESYLTELEQMLTREMAMVTVMALMLPAMIKKPEVLRQGLREGGLL